MPTDPLLGQSATAPKPLRVFELHAIYYWLNRARLEGRGHLSDETLREIEALEGRVHELWLSNIGEGRS